MSVYFKDGDAVLLADIADYHLGRILRFDCSRSAVLVAILTTGDLRTGVIGKSIRVTDLSGAEWEEGASRDNNPRVEVSRARLVVGVETDPDEPDLTRVYIDMRGKWNYVLTSGDDAERVKREWANTARHLTTVIEPGTPIYHDADGLAAAREAVR